MSFPPSAPRARRIDRLAWPLAAWLFLCGCQAVPASPVPPAGPEPVASPPPVEEAIAEPAPLGAPSGSIVRSGETYAGGVILGPGDVVGISVLGQPELSATVDVDASGRISVPLAGSVRVGGLSTAIAAAVVAQALRDRGIVLNPQVTVTTVESRSQQVSVLGEVRKPGRFNVDSRITVLDALALAGGINEAGGNVVHVMRREGGQAVRHTLDVEALMQSGGAYKPFEIYAGDTVMVPKAEVFYIYGEVKAPNAYRLKPDMTVIQALSLAGGLTERGSDSRVEIRRRDASGRLREMAVGLGDLIRPGDIVYVKERLF